LSTNKPQSSGVNLVDITDAEHNQRLDNFLCGQLGGIPKTRVYRSIRKGEVRVNKKRKKPDYKLQSGDQVRIPPMRIDPAGNNRRSASPKLVASIEQSVLYETDDILVINKPAGIAVHRGSGVDFGVIDILRQLKPDSGLELVHRLDRDTSGCLLLAKHRPALLAMQACLQEKSLTKRYCAVVQGAWPQHVRQMDYPLKKIHLSNGERRMRVDPSGKPALTRVRILRAGDRFSSIQLDLVTGRTHQIRVHCQAEGHPIAGDDKYGDDEFNRMMRRRGVKRLMLHAACLEFPASDYTQELVINAALPDEFEAYV
jgi:23S rRNA pseudouridine955/2504/2580 synthase